MRSHLFMFLKNSKVNGKPLLEMTRNVQNSHCGLQQSIENSEHCLFALLPLFLLATHSPTADSDPGPGESPCLRRLAHLSGLTLCGPTVGPSSSKPGPFLLQGLGLRCDFRGPVLPLKTKFYFMTASV